MMEDLYIVFGSISSSFKLTCVVKWTHKSNKFTGNYPIKITVFNFLVVFIFLVIKFFAIVPSKFNCKFKAF